MPVNDGWLEIPSEPGLGVKFNPEEAKKHPYEPVDLYNLHRPEMALKIPKFIDRIR